MTAQQINIRALKEQAAELLRDAQVSPRLMTALYLGLVLILDMATSLSGEVEILSTFLSFLTTLTATVLGAGYVMYCMAIRRGERAETLTLFDGFSMAGKIIALSLLINLLVSLWSIAFVIPGIIVQYRYRFALLNLYENPDLGILDAMRLSSRQTYGYKKQLLMLDISYLGWVILASLPNLIYNGILYSEAFRLASAYVAGPGGALPAIDPNLLAFPGWAWVLISGLWSMVFAQFYLAKRRCVELAFFEAARATPVPEKEFSLPDPWYHYEDDNDSDSKDEDEE